MTARVFILLLSLCFLWASTATAMSGPCDRMEEMAVTVFSDAGMTASHCDMDMGTSSNEAAPSHDGTAACCCPVVLAALPAQPVSVAVREDHEFVRFMGQVTAPLAEATIPEPPPPRA